MMDIAQRRAPAKEPSPARRARPASGAAAPASVAAQAAKGACTCGGRCPRCEDARIYPKLTPTLATRQADDPLERDADRIAERALRAESDAAPGADIAALAGRGDDLAPSGGRPLERGAREDMEARFGADLGAVRVHSGPNAARAAEHYDARAYAAGRNIVFGEGEYAPQSTDGRRLLAHELAHVVQQSAATQPSLQKQKKSTPAGKITYHFEQKLEDQFLWPNALGAIGWLQQTPVGNEIWDALIAAGAVVTIIFVAERKDIPGGKYDTLGFCDELGGGAFAVYVIAGQEEHYFVTGPQGSETMNSRTVQRPQLDIAGTLFHELLHAWFLTTLPGEPIPTGHTQHALGVGDPKFDAKEYDPRFLERLKRFDKELAAAQTKSKAPKKGGK
jgi:Domain of unknown function (DUF4157)